MIGPPKRRKKIQNAETGSLRIADMQQYVPTLALYCLERQVVTVKRSQISRRSSEIGIMRSLETSQPTERRLVLFVPGRLLPVYSFSY